MTSDMVEAAQGDFFVSITDIHPGVDSLVALRGPERLSMDLYDYPEIIKEAMLKIWEPFKDIYEQTHLITTKNLIGSSNWMGHGIQVAGIPFLQILCVIIKQDVP